MARMQYTSVAGLNTALRKLPKEASARLRDASEEIAADVARVASSRAMGLGGPASIVAPTIRGTRDRVPVVKMGSAKRIRKGSASQTIGNLIWGAEFGGGARPTTQQFSPHLGTTGYFLWPTVREMNDEIRKEYSEALDKALEAI
jgi:hypothetical protein